MATSDKMGKEMISYVATRESLFTMNATIAMKSETGETVKYGWIGMAKFGDRGTITISGDGEGKDSGIETSYNVKRRKPTKGFILVPSEGADDDTVTPTARAWRGGILTRTMTIVVDGTVFCMARENWFKNCKFSLYKAGTIGDIMNDESAEALIRLKANGVKKGKMDDETVKELLVGFVQKDGFFKKTYSLSFEKDSPKLLPALVMWFSAMFERQDVAAGGGGVAGASAAGAF